MLCKENSRDVRHLPPGPLHARRATAVFRPRLESLEDRTVPYTTVAGWGTTTHTYSYNNLLDGWTNIPVGERTAAVEESMGAWTAVSPLKIVERVDPTPGADDNNYNGAGYPTFRWGHHLIDGVPQPTPATSDPLNTLAHGFFSGGNGINGDMHFDDGDTWTTNQFLEVGTHEFGHALGMGHANGDATTVCPPPFEAIMHACIGGGGTWAFNGLGTGSLRPDDIAGIRSLYGAGLGYVLNRFGDLHVYGTNQRNVFSVNVSKTSVAVSSEGNGSFALGLGGINSIDIHAQEGNDEIRVHGAGGTPVFLYGERGDDRFVVESTGNALDSTITVDGDDGADTLTVPSDLGKHVNFDGGGGNDALSVGDVPAATNVDIINGLVGVQTAGRNALILANNVQRITATGDVGDTVNVLSVRAGLPVSVIGVGTVTVPRLGSVNDRVNVSGRGVPDLTVADTGSSPARFFVNRRGIDAYVGGSRRLIDYTALRSLIVTGNASGNSFVVNDTQNTPTVLNTGFGVDTVAILGTTGHLTVNGMDSRIPHHPDGIDTVSVGNNANVRAVKGEVVVTNVGAYVALAVEDAADNVARAVTISEDGNYHRVNGLTASGSVAVRSRDVKSLTVRAGHTDNTFRIDDTPVGNFPGGALTTLVTGLADDIVTVTGTAGALDLDSDGGSDTTVVGSAVTGLDRILGAVHFSGRQSGTAVTIRDGTTSPFQLLTYTVTATGVTRTAAAPITMFGVGSFLLQTGRANDTIRVFGNPTYRGPSAFQIRSGPGNDGVEVGNGRLADIGPLAFDGGAGIDRLTLSDSARAAGATYTFGVAGSPFLATPDAKISYAATEVVTLNGGNGDDTFLVTRTAAGTTTNLNGGGGNDGFVVGNPFGSGRVAGQLRFDGQAGIDLLRGPDAATRWNLTGPNAGDLGPAVSFAAVENLLGGAAADTFVIAGGAGLRGAIDGGGGVNTLDYSAFSAAAAAGPVARYLGEGDAADAAGGNDGTLVNGADFADGRVGQAFRFDGVDDHVRVPNAARLESPTVTVEAWVNATAPGTNAYVVAKGASGATAASYALSTGATGGLSFYVFDGATYASSPDAGAGVWDGNWHHVVGTYDGAAVCLYVDGAEVGAGTATDPHIGYGLPTGNDLTTGSYQGDISLPVAGLINEVGVYNRALSPAEVRAQYSGGSAAGTGVVVDLPLGTATGLAGGVARIQNVVGSPGDDLLVGNGGNVLTGGAGRDVLIAGASPSVLLGGEGDDLLVGGATDYDRNPAILRLIQTIWANPDADYAARVSLLRDGTAESRGLLSATTVHGGGGHTLTGGGVPHRAGPGPPKAAGGASPSDSQPAVPPRFASVPHPPPPPGDSSWPSRPGLAGSEASATRTGRPRRAG